MSTIATHGKEGKSGSALSITDKRRREIAALEVELAMTEAHAKKLSSTLLGSDGSNLQPEMAALLEEEKDRAEQLRRRLRLLGDDS